MAETLPLSEPHAFARLTLLAKSGAAAWKAMDAALIAAGLEQNTLFTVPLGRGGVPEEGAAFGTAISPAFEQRMRAQPELIASIPGFRRMVASDAVVEIFPGTPGYAALSAEERAVGDIMQECGFRGGFTASFPFRVNRAMTVFSTCSLTSAARAQAAYREAGGAAISAIAYFLEGLAVRRIADAPGFIPLSGREAQCLDLVAIGRNTKQIGERLSLTERTVNEYVAKAMAKLEASNRTHASTRAALLRELEASR